MNGRGTLQWMSHGTREKTGLKKTKDMGAQVDMAAHMYARARNPPGRQSGNYINNNNVPDWDEARTWGAIARPPPLGTRTRLQYGPGRRGELAAHTGRTSSSPAGRAKKPAPGLSPSLFAARRRLAPGPLQTTHSPRWATASAPAGEGTTPAAATFFYVLLRAFFEADPRRTT